MNCVCGEAFGFEFGGELLSVREVAGADYYVVGVLFGEAGGDGGTDSLIGAADQDDCFVGVGHFLGIGCSVWSWEIDLITFGSFGSDN